MEDKKINVWGFRGPWWFLTTTKIGMGVSFGYLVTCQHFFFKSEFLSLDFFIYMFAAAMGVWTTSDNIVNHISKCKECGRRKTDCWRWRGECMFKEAK